MKFDTIIIGGGLSGLVCGIRLTQRGQRCVIISSGQSALHFSSGSFDLLNNLPNGKLVENPLAEVKELISSTPNHPYAKLGAERFEHYASEAKKFLTNIKLSIDGDASKNHFRITPMGNLKPAWLTISDFAITQQNNRLPWRRVAIFNPIGFLDFYPRFIADEFIKLGTESDIHLFNLADLEHLRRNPSELRSTNIARVLDKKENRSELIEILKKGSKDCEAILFPAAIGLDYHDNLSELSEAVGKPIFLIPTMPPSSVGIRTQQYLHDYFLKLGGVYMLGDSVLRTEMVDNKITKVYSYNHGNIPFSANNVVLATGSFFSQGLIATNNEVYEPILNLDVSFVPDRPKWYDPNFFEKQNYQEFGVKTDQLFRALKNGKAIDNLYVSGAILDGFNPIKEGSGGGVSILTALAIADSITN